jgi:hypothetical protein
MDVGPLITSSGCTTTTNTPTVGSWKGLTIKEILEKVDLSNIVMDHQDVDTSMNKNKSNSNQQLFNLAANLTAAGEINPEAAFLGPKLWTKNIPMPVNDDPGDFSVMNIDDFLTENGFDIDEGLHHQPSSPTDSSSSDQDMDSSTAGVDQTHFKRSTEPSQEDGATTRGKHPEHDFLYVESKRARVEREKKRKFQEQFEFTKQDLALATVPGMEFDPRNRCFAPDELKPQPIIRKRKKAYVPLESKDNKYWEKRNKNNVAARRSREARRLKENQIALRTAFLERENANLRNSLDEVKTENKELSAEKQNLLEKLKRYEQTDSEPGTATITQYKFL